MRSIMKRRPSAALVVAIVAMSVALSGTATAALVMTGKNIQNGTITGQDVKNRTLAKKKLSKKAIKSLQGRAGPAGPQGPAGVPGTQGAAGPVGPSVTYVDNEPNSITADLTRVLEVSIPPGSYTAQVNMDILIKSGFATGEGECRFRAPGGSSPVLLGYTGPIFMGDVVGNGHFDHRWISYGGAFRSANGGVVEMVCKSPGSKLDSFHGDLTVTKVGELVG